MKLYLIFGRERNKVFRLNHSMQTSPQYSPRPHVVRQIFFLTAGSLSCINPILNLRVPLDYHAILGAGVFTVIYIVSRALGKYFGAYWGASITHASQTVKKYLGFTLLSHSSVSLVFTGICCFHPEQC